MVCAAASERAGDGQEELLTGKRILSREEIYIDGGYGKRYRTIRGERDLNDSDSILLEMPCTVLLSALCADASLSSMDLRSNSHQLLVYTRPAT